MSGVETEKNSVMWRDVLKSDSREAMADVAFAWLRWRLFKAVMQHVRVTSQSVNPSAGPPPQHAGCGMEPGMPHYLSCTKKRLSLT